MKEKLHLTENMKEQINKALENTVKDLWNYEEFKNPTYPNLVMLEAIILEMFPYSVARELLNTIDEQLAAYYKRYNEKKAI